MEGHEELLVGLKGRTEEQRHKLRDTELKIVEADVPKVPAKVYTPSPEEYNRHCAIFLVPSGTGARSACRPRNEPLPTTTTHHNNNKHNASDRANKHVPVIAIDFMYMNEMTDDTNSHILVIHDSCSEGVWFVLTKKGDGAHVKNKVANITGCLGFSKIVIKSDQQLAIRSMERNGESLSEHDFKELRVRQVVMQHSPVEESSRTRFSECKERSDPTSWTWS